VSKFSFSCSAFSFRSSELFQHLWMDSCITTSKTRKIKKYCEFVLTQDQEDFWKMLYSRSSISECIYAYGFSTFFTYYMVIEN